MQKYLRPVFFQYFPNLKYVGKCSFLIQFDFHVVSMKYTPQHMLVFATIFTLY